MRISLDLGVSVNLGADSSFVYTFKRPRCQLGMMAGTRRLLCQSTQKVQEPPQYGRETPEESSRAPVGTNSGDPWGRSKLQKITHSFS